VIRWAPWTDVAFSRARAEGKPVLLALTATWCHACQRMYEETWGDPGVAALVERRVVPVRVDADERPDLYARYHLGGLPTTAVLSADGEFIRGGTFLSPTQCLGLLDAALGDHAAGRRPAPRPPAPLPAPTRLVDEIVERLKRRADLEHGGFGVAPKLPEPDAVTLLLRRRQPELERIARLTLDALGRHLADPIDGGFYRYAAGQDWSGPHTEKLAVDQAALIRLFLEAGVVLGERRYLEVARAALAHARRRLADDAGRVLASVAADPDYYARRDELEPPPVDRRRFADAAAAMSSAGLLGMAVTGEDAGFTDELSAAAPSGAIPHRLDERGGVSGLLGDQALAIRAAVDGYQLTGDASALDFGRRVARWSLESLWDEAAGAFRLALAEGLPAMYPLTGNAEMALALADLSDHAGEPRGRDIAARVIDSLGPRALRSPAGAALGLAALRLEEEPPRADLVGEPTDPRAIALARAVVGALGPTTVVRWTPGSPACLTLCVRDLCLPPLGDPADLRQSLVDLGLAPRAILGASR
jgi:hypothetical protein